MIYLQVVGWSLDHYSGYLGLKNDIFAGGGLELGSLFRLPRVK